LKAIADTNVLIRMAVQDDPQQAATAFRLLRNAEAVMISLPCICEFVWVLRRFYKFGKSEIAAAIEELLRAKNVVIDRSAVDAGLATLYGNGDFADGIMAWEGSKLGGEIFASFDKDAVKLLATQGYKTKLLP
jgi:predicted nucleic-acid-binding protein